MCARRRRRRNKRVQREGARRASKNKSSLSLTRAQRAQVPEALADFQLKLNRSAVGLRDLLLHPHGQHRFSQHLSQEFSAENIKVRAHAERHSYFTSKHFSLCALNMIKKMQPVNVSSHFSLSLCLSVCVCVCVCTCLCVYLCV